MADKTLPPLAFGDSLAEGIRTSNKLEGSTRSGAGPREVLDKIKAYALSNSLEGRDVFIGTGIPNIPDQKKFIEEQVDFVRQKGGNPILIGVGPGTKAKPTTGQNEYLAELAKRKGLPYMGPLVNIFPDVVKDPMGLHLRGPQYKQIVKQFSSGAVQEPSPAPTKVTPPYQPSKTEVVPAQNQAPRTTAPVPRQGGKFDPDPYLQDPNVQKFLDYINAYEGSPRANQTVGYKEFNSFEDHPRIPIIFNKKGDRSDAAGMFQILSRTWDGQRKKLGLRDFSVENQKRAAIGILHDIGALPDIVSGNFDAAKPKAARQWASIPGSTIGLSTGQIPRYKPKVEEILGQPVRQSPFKRADNAPAMRKVDAGGQLAPRSAAEVAPQPEVVTRADVERLGPSYQAALAAVTLGDSRDDDEEEDSIAEKYRREQEENERTEDIFNVPQRVAGLELGYQSPFGEEQAPVMMAEGGEAKSMLRRMYEGAVPAQARLFMETAFMPEDKRAASTITAQDFSDEEQRRILDTIVNARKNRMQERGLTEITDPKIREQAYKRLKKGLSPETIKDLESSQKKRKAEDKYFLSGKGSVFYGDYPGDTGARLTDATLGREGAIRNTLGRFVYETTPEGKINIKETYDFKDDLVRELNQRPSAEYAGMSTGQKINALVMDTLHNPADAIKDSGTRIGRTTLPGRVGSAFIGDKGRPVDVTIDPRELMPGYAGYAEGGEVATGGITPDTIAAFRNVQIPNAREALNALFKIGREGVSNLESLARGSVAGVPGVVGDIESFFRDNKARKFATSEEIERQYLPKRMSAPTKEAQGFVEIGTAIDPSIALKAAKPAAKLVKKTATELGPTAAAQLERLAPAAQPMYAVKPKGGVFFPQGSGSVMDDYLDRVVKGVSRYGENISGKDAQRVADFIQEKGRKYLTTTYATGSDPLRDAILEGRVKLTGEDAEKIRRYATTAAREGDPEALQDVERAYDALTSMRGNLVLPAELEWSAAAGKRLAAKSAETEKMLKEGVSEGLTNPSVTSKDLAELSRTYSSDAEKMLAALVAGERKPVIGAEQATLTAAQKGEPIYDLTSLPQLEIMRPDVVAKGIATIPVDELVRMSYPEMVIRGAKNTLLERSGDAVIQTLEKGKNIPKKFYAEGVTPVKGLENTGWVTVNTPFAVKLEGAAMNHSVGGYADPGSYGHGGRKAFLEGKAKVFSLRPEAGKPAVTVEARVDPEGLYVTQIKGPFNSAPTPEEKRKIFQLFDSLRPYKFKPENYSRNRAGETVPDSSVTIDWGDEYQNYLQYQNKGAE